MRRASCSLLALALAPLALAHPGSPGSADDVDRGCGTSGGLYMSMGCGLLAGLFIAVALSCSACLYQSRRRVRDMLSAPPDRVGRAQAEIQDKWMRESEFRSRGDADSGPGTTTRIINYHFKLQFPARRRDGTAYTVRSVIEVGPAYSKYEKGSQVEVAYVIGNEIDFILTDEDECAPMLAAGLHWCLCCMSSPFVAIGSFLAVFGGMVSGCWLSIVYAFILGAGLPVVAWFSWYPCFRLCMSIGGGGSAVPCDHDSHPGAVPIGAAEAEA